jgi:hypothetical protein
MKSDRLTRRLAHLEASLTGVTGDTTSLVELTAALKACTATPVQLERISAIAGEDIRNQLVRLARHQRRFKEEGSAIRRDTLLHPMDRAVEILGYRADQSLELPPQFVPTYDPEAWAHPMRYRGTSRYAPGCFEIWSRTFLVSRVLGDDDGLTMRHEIDRWMDGGEPPIDGDRYPEARVYRLLGPIETPEVQLDARMLRLPTRELFREIGNYDCWDPPEDGQQWTTVDITGHETLDAFECLTRQTAIESQSQQPPGHCGDSCS